MSKRKAKIEKYCVICGSGFMTAREAVVCCSPECSEEMRRRRMRELYRQQCDQINARRRQLNHPDVTEARMAEIALVQDSGDNERLRQHAATWTQAERKYALDRYRRIHTIY